jgi:hypothetical protein
VTVLSIICEVLAQTRLLDMPNLMSMTGYSWFQPTPTQSRQPCAHRSPLHSPHAVLLGLEVDSWGQGLQKAMPTWPPLLYHPMGHLEHVRMSALVPKPAARGVKGSKSSSSHVCGALGLTEMQFTVSLQQPCSLVGMLKWIPDASN